ncbi:hypothetical protein QBC34DRAFT_264226, partial [Podospora aff. communis PSN243]
LQKRQTGLHCHGSGSWAKQRVMTEGIGEACTSLRDTPRGQTLSLGSSASEYIPDAAIGRTRILKVPGFNSAGHSMDTHYTKRCSTWNNNVAYRYSVCRAASHGIITTCVGNNQDSRGGTTNWADGNWYAVDPQTHGCNC